MSMVGSSTVGFCCALVMAVPNKKGSANPAAAVPTILVTPNISTPAPRLIAVSLSSLTGESSKSTASCELLSSAYEFAHATLFSGLLPGLRSDGPPDRSCHLAQAPCRKHGSANLPESLPPRRSCRRTSRQVASRRRRLACCRASPVRHPVRVRHPAPEACARFRFRPRSLPPGLPRLRCRPPFHAHR